jgi:hypothetical protein
LKTLAGIEFVQSPEMVGVAGDSGAKKSGSAHALLMAPHA